VSTEPEIELFSGRELVSTRVFDSPRELVYAAFSDPLALAAWWGPQGFSNSFQEFDFRPGGAWRYVMHAPDGTDSEHESVFVDVVAPERIVFRHLRPMHEYRASILLTEQNGRTGLVWKMLFESVAECQRVRPFVVPANEQNLDRLQAHLGEPARAATSTGRGDLLLDG
jgi:uncharacterized protein YndB with AHSA1/START domain